jgi:STAS domain-containing protein
MNDRPPGQAHQEAHPRADVAGDILRVLRSRALPDVVIVRAVGEVDLATATRLHAAIVNAIPERPRVVSVDLSELSFWARPGWTRSGTRDAPPRRAWVSPR